MRTLTVLFAVAGVMVAGARAQTDDARTNAITDRYLTSVSAELTGKIDTRSAAAGQEVDATTRQSATLADGTELSAGTKLVGRIVSVQAQDRDKGRPGAVLAILFDHAVLKGGQAVRLRVVLQAVAPMASPATTQYIPLGASASSVSTRGMGPGAGGGGGVGSAGTDAGAGADSGNGGGVGAGASPGGIGDAGPLAGAVSKIGRLPGTVSDTASNTVGVPVGQTGSPVIHAGESLSTAPERTGVAGVWMARVAPANASGVLLSYDRNIALAAGTEIRLGVITR
jgi:hypothetical protein